ncbi:endonuclease III [Candidatus Poribacteria bacterium]|nr:endonuclease III [Candidatus Poribacteria bacterium]
MEFNSPDNIKNVIKILKKTYPEAKIALNYKNPLELLISTILSAQCTDIMVNKVTEKLFEKYKTVQDYANADITTFEQDIRSTGFYHNKARNIINTSKMLTKKYNGIVPQTMDELTELPGVARKTANIVLGSAFKIAVGIPVDTHVKRLSQRLGWTIEQTPEKIEKILMKLILKNEWMHISYYLIEHGRKVCIARKPKCEICPLQKHCFYYSNF